MPILSRAQSFGGCGDEQGFAKFTGRVVFVGRLHVGLGAEYAAYKVSEYQDGEVGRVRDYQTGIHG